MSQLLAAAIALSLTLACPHPPTDVPPAGPPEPLMPGPEAREGVTFEVTGIYAGVTASPQNSPRGWVWSRHLKVSIRVSAPEDGPLFQPLHPVLDECSDERGTAVKFAPARNAGPSRSTLADAMRSMAHSRGERSAYAQAEAYGLRRIPARLTSLRGHVDVLVAGTIADKEVPPEFMADYVEVAPGARFLLSRFDKAPDGCWVDYEVRLARRSGDGPATVEDPVFVGVQARTETGELIQTIFPTQELETRDEIIAVARDVNLPREWGTQIDALHVLVATDIKTVRFDFAAANVPLATPD